MVLLLYWLESGVVGLYNVLRMLNISAKAGTYFVPFFVVHYGLFMFVHLLFIVAFFGRGNEPREILSGIGVGIAALLISHGVSYRKNFIGGQEYKERTVKQQLFAPYGRIIVMHLTVLFGGWLVLGLGEPVGALVIMVVAKTAIDSWAHIHEHNVR